MGLVALPVSGDFVTSGDSDAGWYGFSFFLLGAFWPGEEGFERLQTELAGYFIVVGIFAGLATFGTLMVLFAQRRLRRADRPWQVWLWPQRLTWWVLQPFWSVDAALTGCAWRCYLNPEGQARAMQTQRGGDVARYQLAIEAWRQRPYERVVADARQQWHDWQALRQRLWRSLLVMLYMTFFAAVFLGMAVFVRLAMYYFWWW